MRHRRAFGLLITHLLSMVGEWGVTVGVLVLAFNQRGAGAVGLVSLALLTPSLGIGPLIAWAQRRWRTHTIRLLSLVVQVACFSAAAITVTVQAPMIVTVGIAVVGLTGMVAIPATTVALLPHSIETAADLVRLNLWTTRCDAASGLLGTIGAALLLGVAGPAGVLAFAAVAATFGLIATSLLASPPMRAARGSGTSIAQGAVRRTFAELGAHSWGRAVLAVTSARHLVIGALDVLLVILAIDALGLGDAGPGLLGALVGAGALASTLATSTIVARAHVRGALILAAALAATLMMLVGARPDRPVVLLTLPAVGLAIAAIDALSRVMLVRRVDPRNLAPLYASLALLAGVGQIAGSALAQIVVGFGDVRTSFVALGVVLAALAAVGYIWLRSTDEHTEIPAVEMALLDGLPVLAELPTADLERIAHATERVQVAAGSIVIQEGVPVEECHVIVNGEFTVTVGGHTVGTLRRGDVVGAVALVSQMTPHASVQAATDGETLRVERQSFLVALAGQGVAEIDELPDLAPARGRLRDAVAAHERFADATTAERADLWLEFGVAGRMLGEPSFIDALVRSAKLAEQSGDTIALAEAAAFATWPASFFFVADNPDHEAIALCERALTALDSDRDAVLRVRVLASLASHLAFASPIERRQALIDEALVLAEHLGDRRLIGAVLNAEFTSMWEPGTLDRREKIGPELAAIGSEVDDVELRFVGGFFTAVCETERGLLTPARARLVELRTVAAATNIEYFDFLTERLLLAIDIALGHLDVQERIDGLAARHEHTYADTAGTWALQTGGLAYQSGRLGEMVPTLITMLDGPHARTWRAALALAHVQAGDDEAARAVFTEMEPIPQSYFWLTATQTRAESAAELGLVDECRSYLEEMAPFGGQVGVTASGTRLFGLVSRSLGDLSLAIGRLDDADRYLRQAVGDADAAGFVFESVIARRLLAQCELARGEPDRAQALVDHALPLAVAHGFAREAELMERLAATLEPEIR